MKETILGLCIGIVVMLFLFEYTALNKFKEEKKRQEKIISILCLQFPHGASSIGPVSIDKHGKVTGGSLKPTTTGCP